MKQEDRMLTITTEDGKEILCEILFTHHSEDFNKDYVVFVQQGTNEASAATYVPTEDKSAGRLEGVETEEEWHMLEELLADFSKNHEQHECSCGHCDGSCGDDCDCDDHECDCDDHECSCGCHDHN